jgi:biotin carboxyl carrier protein
MTREALRATALDGDGEWLVVGPERPEVPDAPDAVERRGAPDGAVVVVLPAIRDWATGRVTREVVVGGWRFEVDVEPERRAQLRERAGRAGDRAAHHGGLEVRAVIPGRIVSVAVAPGDKVAKGDRLLVVEAMKMQNDVRAPRAGRIARVAVGAGQTVELRDVLVELE